MSRILFDANMPRPLRDALSDHEVVTAAQMGWGALENGELLAAAEADGFQVMLTGDRNLLYQQNLAGRNLALIVLDPNHWPTIRANVDRVVEAVNAATAGSYQAISFDPPALLRRPYNPTGDG
jgi:predicted nuclease of predicted toxin-antitoxin system